MVSLDDLKELTLYKKQFFLPIDLKDKKHGSAIMLLTPSRRSSILAMTAPYTVNRRYVESYYLEKDITRYIQNESVVSMEDPGEYLFEASMTSEERNSLKDSEFGLPDKRKYPLNDKEHILLAIRFFNYCPKEDKAELAKNILKAIGKKFDSEELQNINVGKNNSFLPYWENSKYYKKASKVSEASIEVSISEAAAEEYFNEYVNNHSIITLGKKASGKEIVFTGYSRDINRVKPFIDKDYIELCFDRINKKAPNKVNIIATSDTSVPEDFTDTSVVIYTPEALKKYLPTTSYETYISYILQLYAIYTLKPDNGVYHYHKGRIMDSIAEPAAIVLSEILDDSIANNDKNVLGTERVFKYIIDTYGKDTFIDTISSNNTKFIFKCAKEFGMNSAIDKMYFESMQLMREEAEEDTESEPVANVPSIDNPLPESIKRIQNMSTRLKRRIKQHSIYKLNKIVRDLQRGNVGSETRGYISDIEKLQAGNIASTAPAMTNAPAVSTESFEKYTNGDYILEGNCIYLFEASDKYNTVLRKALFKDRFKNNKEILRVYSQIKAELPFIKYTYTDISRYGNKNVFVDLSYYNESFFRNISNMNDEDKNNTIRIFNIYMELMERLVKNTNLSSYKKKTIFIPVLDWRHNNSMKMWMYKEDINPISAIYHMIKKNPASLKRVFGDNDIVFLGGKNYFKINFSKINFSKQENVVKFTNLIKRIITLGYNMEDPDPAGEFSDSPKGIAMDIIDKVETSQKVSINNVSKVALLGKNIDLTATNKITPTDLANKVEEPSTDVVDSEIKQTTSLLPDDNKSENDTTEEDKKNSIVDAIVVAADKSSSVDGAMKNLDTDEFKNMILNLQNDSVNNARISRTQASKVIEVQSEFRKKQIAGRSVEEMLNKTVDKKELPKTELKVASINNDWKELSFVNFDKDYDLNADIMKMLDSMKDWTYPIAVKNVDIKDNSTSEDLLDLWTIECVDFRGIRFTLRVDIPKFINGSNFLKLRGNEKNIMIQSVLLPVIKSSADECQIISVGYNKTFIVRYGARVGQSTPAATNLIRALTKYNKSKKDIKVVYGNNNKVCSKYNLPMDYIDISRNMNSIETDNLKIYFNQDELREEYTVDDTKGIPIGVMKNVSNKKETHSILYFDGTLYPTITNMIAKLICDSNPDFAKIYNNIKVSGSRFSYSKAKILNEKIPVVLICGYLEGLIPTMDKAGIKYRFEKELSKDIKYSDIFDFIKFEDGYLIYNVTYSSSLLMNGLKEFDTESYKINDINNRMMYIDFFNTYGRDIPNGLENSYDCMLDPITKEILEKCNLPTDYVSLFLYASNLLADNKYVKHIDQTGRRWRRKEVIAGYFYKALCNAYQGYSRSLRNSRKASSMTMKQSDIIDLILSNDPSTVDLSVNSALNDVECANTVTNKGLVGMNVARGYTINTRGYDDSMLNLLGMDTGFSGNVGINRQATINANIEGGRGFVKSIDSDTSKLSAAASFTMTEAVTPFGCTHDDPQRTLMTYVQTSKHMVRCVHNDPTLVTTGADEAMPYLTSDIFAYKAKKDGKVIEIVEEGLHGKNYLVVEYNDKTHEFVNLSEEVKKNSDGGYYVPLKLDTELSLGSKFKAGDILAYDKSSFSRSLGESGNLAATIGTLAKVAIINTDEAFEDSAIITETFSEKIATNIIQSIDTKVKKGSNIFVYKNLGDSVMEGDTLFSFQADFDDDVFNNLLKNLTVNSEFISELGRTPIKSKYTGVVADIVIYRTCELEDMSESLREFVLKYENKIKDIREVYDKYGIDASQLPRTEKVPEIGRTKNLNDAVMIIYFIKSINGIKAGEKCAYYSANKGIIKSIIKKEDEPYTEFRPNEHIDSFMSLSSISGRMTFSIALFAAVSKLMVELDRSVKDLAGIPYDESKL